MQRFYGQAMIRAAGRGKVNLEGLDIGEGYLEGGKNFAKWDESSLVIGAPSDPQAVQVILSPRVEGPSAGDSNFSADKLAEIRKAQVQALENSRYLSVELGKRSDVKAIGPKTEGGESGDAGGSGDDAGQ